jgi:ABC-type sugar transport system permease subunit
MSILRTRKQVLLFVPQIVLLAAMYAYPVVRTLVQSFYNASFGSQEQVPVGLANYKTIFADSAFWAACLNSLY